MQATYEGVCGFALRGKVWFLWIQGQDNLCPRLGTILTKAFVALGNLQESMVLVLTLPLASCVTLKHQWTLWASVSYLQEEELDGVNFNAFQLLNSLIL